MKIVFITSRGGTHPIHKAYAESIHADFQFIDFKLPWHGVQSSRLKKYLSWIVCSLTFPNRKEYDLFLVSGQQVMPALMKVFRRLNKTQKLVCFHANEGLYFTHSKKYGRINRWLISVILPLYDVHICVGKMQAELLQKVTNNRVNHIFTIENGISKKLHQELANITPKLQSKQILFIGNLYAGWRSWYKGIDIMIEAVIQALQFDKSITLRLVGSYTDDFNEYFQKLVPDHARENIQLIGSSNNISEEFTNTALYLHCGRGDAFPTTTLEAMASGVPCILSQQTGTYYLLNNISPENIVSLNPSIVAKAIIRYFEKDPDEKIELSNKLKKLSNKYLLENKLEEFKAIIMDIYKL